MGSQSIALKNSLANSLATQNEKVLGKQFKESFSNQVATVASPRMRSLDNKKFT